MKHFIKKRVTVYINGKRKFYYINKLLKELFTPEELNVYEVPSMKLEYPKNEEEENAYFNKVRNSKIRN
jgi:hypothetical protein